MYPNIQSELCQNVIAVYNKVVVSLKHEKNIFTQILFV